jgi:hypothetical protein
MGKEGIDIDHRFIGDENTIVALNFDSILFSSSLLL